MPRPFERGNPGRPKGAVGKATVEIKALSRRLLEDPEYQASLRGRLRRGTAQAIERELYHYAYGKPKDTVELTGGLSIRWLDE